MGRRRTRFGPYAAAVQVADSLDWAGVTGWACHGPSGPREGGEDVLGLFKALLAGADGDDVVVTAFTDCLADTGSAIVHSLLRSGLKWAELGALGPGRVTAAVGRGDTVLAVGVGVGGAQVWLYGLDTGSYGPLGADPSSPPMGRLQVAENRISQLLPEDLAMTAPLAGWRAYRAAYGYSRWQRDTPPLPESLSQWLWEAYRTGDSYARQIHCTGSLEYLDVRGAYPAALASAPVPYGRPVLGEGPPPPGGLWVAELTLSYLLRSRGVPCLTDLGEVHRAVRPHRDGETRTVRLSSVEWATVQRQYQVDVLAWGRWAWWPVRPIPPAAARWLAETREAGGVVAKVMTNAVTGRYGRGPRATTRVPRLTGLGELRWEDAPLVDPVPAAGMPVAIAVVDRQRARMVDAVRWARAHHGRVLHSQTDGMLVQWLHGRPTRPPDRARVRPGFGDWRRTDVHEARVWPGGQWAYRDDDGIHAHVGYVPEDVWRDEPSLAPGTLPGRLFTISSRVPTRGGDWRKREDWWLDPDGPNLYYRDDGPVPVVLPRPAGKETGETAPPGVSELFPPA